MHFKFFGLHASQYETAGIIARLKFINLSVIHFCLSVCQSTLHFEKKSNRISADSFKCMFLYFIHKGIVSDSNNIQFMTWIRSYQIYVPVWLNVYMALLLWSVIIVDCHRLDLDQDAQSRKTTVNKKMLECPQEWNLPNPLFLHNFNNLGRGDFVICFELFFLAPEND